MPGARCSTRWAGTTTACPPSGACRTLYGVRCDPSLPYDEEFAPPFEGGEGKSGPQLPVSRKNFVELCERLSVEDERLFEALWRRLGLSVDWSRTYQTVSAESRAVAQQAFLRNLARDEAYQAEAPGLWGRHVPDGGRPGRARGPRLPGRFHKVAFPPPDGTPVFIETTRPSCCPRASRSSRTRTTSATSTCSAARSASPLVRRRDPRAGATPGRADKGRRIAMCCTFGDLTDVQWWRELQLPTRSVVGRDGRILRDTPTWLVATARAPLRGAGRKTTFSAREAVVAACARPVTWTASR